MTTPRTWHTFCNDYGPDTIPGSRHQDFGDPRTVRMSGVDAPVIAVHLVEDETGDLRGWVAAGETKLIMVQHHKLFNMGFPAGYVAAEELGQGQSYRLRVDTEAELTARETAAVLDISLLLTAYYIGRDELTSTADSEGDPRIPLAEITAFEDRRHRANRDVRAAFARGAPTIEALLAAAGRAPHTSEA